MKRHWSVGIWMIMIALLVSGNIPSIYAEEGSDREAILKRLEQLEREVKVLKQKLELDEKEQEKKSSAVPVVAANAPDAPVVTAGKDGFGVSSADKAFQLKLRGYVQADGRFFTEKETVNSTFVARRVRPIFEGTLWETFGFRIMPDFGNGASTLSDAYIDGNFSPATKLRVGKFKPPIGLEQFQGDTDTAFSERALPNGLLPQRDVGIQIFGDLFANRLGYSAGIFNGALDGTSPDTDTDDDKDLVARIFAEPFKGDGPRLLQGLGFGVGATVGHREGSPASYRTSGQQTFFSWRTDVVADGRQTRLAPQASYYLGPLGLLAEFVQSSQKLRRAGVTSKLDTSSWEITGSYFLTGEDSGYKGIKVRNPFDWKQKNWGAWELVTRYANLSIDKDAYPNFATITSSAQTADAFGIGVNWHLNKNLKWLLSYELTDFDRGSNLGDRDSESVILTRLQASY